MPAINFAAKREMTIYADQDATENLGVFNVHVENGRCRVQVGQVLLPVEYRERSIKCLSGYFSKPIYATILKKFHNNGNQ